MLRIYIIGLSILIIAIIANAIVAHLSIVSWYDFLNLLSSERTGALTKLSFFDYIWLFIGYPLVLGFAYWIGDQLFQLLFG